MTQEGDPEIMEIYFLEGIYYSYCWATKPKNMLRVAGHGSENKNNDIRSELSDLQPFFHLILLIQNVGGFIEFYQRKFDSGRLNDFYFSQYMCWNWD